MLLLLQSPPPEPAPKVELTDEQFSALVEQIQGAGLVVSGYLAVMVMLLGAMVLIMAIGGR